MRSKDKGRPQMIRFMIGVRALMEMSSTGGGGEVRSGSRMPGAMGLCAGKGKAPAEERSQLLVKQTQANLGVIL